MKFRMLILVFAMALARAAKQRRPRTILPRRRCAKTSCKLPNRP